MNSSPSCPSARTATSSPTPAATQTAKSSDLLNNAGSLHIEHQGAIYILRATSKGGLILTK